ncbi:MAG: hypothetical protein ACPHK8_04355 [Thermoplasmatota archaeon]
MARRRNKGEEKAIVRRRLQQLLGEARKESLGPDKDLPARYGQLALRLSQKYKFRLFPDQRVQLCRKCGAYRNGQTTRVRVQKSRIITTCTCGFVHRRPL